MARTRVRWGRVASLLAAGTLAVGLAGHSGMAAGADAPQTTARPIRLEVHEVRAGETIWSIARALVGSDGDPRPVVDAVIGANQLRDAEIFPGQLLVMPETP